MTVTTQIGGKAEEIKKIIRALGTDEKKADELVLKYGVANGPEMATSRLLVTNTIGRLVGSKQISKASRVADFFAKWEVICSVDVAPYKDKAMKGLVASVEKEGSAADRRLTDFGISKKDVEQFCKPKAKERVLKLLAKEGAENVWHATLIAEYFELDLKREALGDSAVRKVAYAVERLVESEKPVLALRTFNAFGLTRKDVKSFMPAMVEGIAQIVTKYGTVHRAIAAAKAVGLTYAETKQVRQMVMEGLEEMVEKEGREQTTGWVSAFLDAVEAYGLKNEAELLKPNVLKKIPWLVDIGLIETVMEAEKYLGLQRAAVLLEVIDGVAGLINKRDESESYDAHIACRKYGLSNNDADAIVAALMSKGSWSETSARQAVASVLAQTSFKQNQVELVGLQHLLRQAS